jgi:NAD-dependent SIR2 family protein deacetylase
MTDDVTDVRTWVDEARRVVVLTDVGISTDSGIPGFRASGVWSGGGRLAQGPRRRGARR